MNISEFKAFRYKGEFLPLILFYAFTILCTLLMYLIFKDIKNLFLPIFILLCCNLLCLCVIIIKFIKIVLGLEAKIIHSIDDTTAEASPTYFSGDVIQQISQTNQSPKMDISYTLLQKQAQLDAMQSQINPHFLYNTLDSIRGLAYTEGAVKSADMIEALSAFFRYSIGGTNDLVELQQEISSIDNYMHIQKYRFNNRYEVVKQIDPDCIDILNYRVPKLTLQPLIENAIYHGLEKKTKGGEIILRIITTQSRLIISIIDNGAGMDDATLRSLNEEFEKERIAQPEKPRLEKGGVALVNVNARIKLLFGNNFGLTAYSTIGIGTEFQITLPLLGKNNERNVTS
jgi:sensor histidine kinase YesM